MVLRRPLVGLALSVVLGMVLAASGLFSFGILLVATLLCLLCAGLFSRARDSRSLVFCCVILVAACRFFVASSTLSGADINQLQPDLPINNIQIIGRISGVPQYYPYRSGSLGTWVLTLACEGIKPSDSWRRQDGRIQVRVSGAAPDDAFRYGERIRVSGTLRKRDFPGGVPMVISVSAARGCSRLSDPPRFSPVVWSQELREAAAERLSRGIETHPDQLAVYSALLLGYRKAVPSDIIRQFKNTGTMHIFAISGLHVGMVGLLITIILKSVGIPRDKWGLWYGS